MSDLNTDAKLDSILKSINDIKNKIDSLEDKLNLMESKINKIQSSIEGIESDFCDDEYEFEIICPYCNTEFVADVSSKTDIRCPECQNIIELDWDEDDSDTCNGNCSSCDSRCDVAWIEKYDDEDC